MNGARLQADINTTKAKVDGLTNSPAKTGLLGRIGIVQNAMDITAAATITDLINVADGLNDMTPGDEFLSKVKAARDGYEILNSTQKSLVSSTNLNKLVEKEKSLVFSSVDFTKTLADNSVSYIVLANDFELDRYIGITRAVKIEGNGKKLTLANQSALYDITSNSAFVVSDVTGAVKISDLIIDMTVDHHAYWESTVPMYFGLQVKGSSDVTLNNITLKGGHAGLYVNASNVTANIIKTEANTLGGIGITGASTFTTNGLNNTHSDATGKPQVWLESTTSLTLNGYTAKSAGTTYEGITVPAGQTFYTNN